MKADQFSRAEENYFLLKQELETGRITLKQFDKAVRRSIVKDAKGHYWRIGRDDKWRRQEGPIWIEADPYAAAANASAPPSFEGLLQIFQFALGLAAVVMLLGLCLVLFAITRTTVNGAVENTSQILGKVLPSSTGVPDIFAKASDKPESVGAANSDAPINSSSSIAQSGAGIPTVTPPGAQPTAGVPTMPPPAGQPTAGIPTATPQSTATAGPTSQPTPTQVVTQAAIGSGVFVTGIQVLPAQPKRKQPIDFAVTFLNNTGQTQSYRWVIQLYRSDTQRGFGNSAVVSIQVPPGTSTLTNTYSGVTGPGGCVSLIAQPQYQVDGNARIAFTAPDGSLLGITFSVCP